MTKLALCIADPITNVVQNVKRGGNSVIHLINHAVLKNIRILEAYP